MRHLTQRAEFYVLTGREPSAFLPERNLSCTGQYGAADALPLGEALDFEKGALVELPSCPVCAVLWDEAVAVRERRKQKEAWLKADEDDNEAFWETLKTGFKYKRMDR